MKEKIKYNKKIHWLWFPITCLVFVMIFGFSLIKPVHAYSVESTYFSGYGTTGLDITFELNATNGLNYVFSPNKNMPLTYEDADFGDYTSTYTHVLDVSTLQPVYLNGRWSISSFVNGESVRYHYNENFAFNNDYLYFDGIGIYVSNFENISKLGNSSPIVSLQKPGGPYVNFTGVIVKYYFYYILNDENASNTLEYDTYTISQMFDTPTNELNFLDIYNMVKYDGFGEDGDEIYIQDVEIIPYTNNLSQDSPYFIVDYYLTYSHFEDYEFITSVGDLYTPSNFAFFQWVRGFISNLPIDVDFSSWLVNSVGAFMNAELFPGFAIGGIFAVMVAFPLVIWFLKLVLGG